MSLAGIATLLVPSLAPAAPKPGTEVARPVHSAAPDANLVKESFVRVY